MMDDKSESYYGCWRGPNYIIANSKPSYFVTYCKLYCLAAYCKLTTANF